MQHFHKIDIKINTIYYEDIEIDMGDKKKFQSSVKSKITGEIYGIGLSSQKKKAQQRAAKDTLIKFNAIGNPEQENEYYEI